jgi:tetratricopeptide (TPR) repeat protein
MKHAIKRNAGILAFVVMLCFFGVIAIAANAGDVGATGDCFPDEPVLTPDMPEYHCNQGSSYYGQGQYDLAIASYQKALEINPSYSSAFYGLAFTCRAQGRLDLAIENYSEVIRLEPEYAQPYASRAELYQVIGRYGDVEKDLDSYVEHYG